MKIWLNNKIVRDKDAGVSIFDRGFLYGDGVFETMRAYNGAVFALDEHLDRLLSSLKILQIKCPYSKTVLIKAIYRLIKLNNLKDTYIRLAITRGAGTIGLAKIECENPTVIIITKPFVPYPAKMYQKGVKVKIVNVRQNENSPLSGIKSASFLNYILARLEAKKAGYDDAILLNSKGKVCEASVSNIFLVKGQQLVTPSLDSGCLPGVTRKIILGLAHQAGFKAKQKTVNVKELYGANEVFLTNSLMELMPVIRVDSKIIGKGIPGSVTKLMSAEYKKYTNHETTRVSGSL